MPTLYSHTFADLSLKSSMLLPHQRLSYQPVPQRVFFVSDRPKPVPRLHRLRQHRRRRRVEEQPRLAVVVSTLRRVMSLPRVVAVPLRRVVPVPLVRRRTPPLVRVPRSRRRRRDGACEGGAAAAAAVRLRGRRRLVLRGVRRGHVHAGQPALVRAVREVAVRPDRRAVEAGHAAGRARGDAAQGVVEARRDVIVVGVVQEVVVIRHQLPLDPRVLPLRVLLLPLPARPRDPREQEARKQPDAHAQPHYDAEQRPAELALLLRRRRRRQRQRGASAGGRRPVARWAAVGGVGGVGAVRGVRGVHAAAHAVVGHVGRVGDGRGHGRGLGGRRRRRDRVRRRQRAVEDGAEGGGRLARQRDGAGARARVRRARHAHEAACVGVDDVERAEQRERRLRPPVLRVERHAAEGRERAANGDGRRRRRVVEAVQGGGAGARGGHALEEQAAARDHRVAELGGRARPGRRGELVGEVRREADELVVDASGGDDGGALWNGGGVLVEEGEPDGVRGVGEEAAAGRVRGGCAEVGAQARRGGVAAGGRDPDAGPVRFALLVGLGERGAAREVVSEDAPPRAAAGHVRRDVRDVRRRVDRDAVEALEPRDLLRAVAEQDLLELGICLRVAHLEHGLAARHHRVARHLVDGEAVRPDGARAAGFLPGGMRLLVVAGAGGGHLRRDGVQALLVEVEDALCRGRRDGEGQEAQQRRRESGGAGGARGVVGATAAADAAAAAARTEHFLLLFLLLFFATPPFFLVITDGNPRFSFAFLVFFS
eukprot:Rhum_TRINITY_DN14711_c6_g1::Rhum_TRINITY_DN14711_c6_g1_i1::g.111619::m.111619